MLNAKQKSAIPKLLQMTSIKDAAHEVGVSERTMHRWLHDPDFTAELHQAQDRIVNSAIRRMSSGTSDAVDCLLEIINDRDAKASSRVNAARILLGEFRHLKEFGELTERVGELERLVLNG